MNKYMKRICLIICICLNLSMILCGCSEDTSNEIDEFSGLYGDESVRVFVDPETGVNYLIYNGVYKGAITVRYNQDGSIMVKSKSEEEE